MFGGPCTVLGGLPLYAEVWASKGDGWTSDDDAGVEALYWLKKDGTKGKPVSQKIYDKLNKKDPFWESHVIEEVFSGLMWDDGEKEDTYEFI